MKILKYSKCRINGNNFFVYIVDVLNCFKTYNEDFITDGEKYILGNRIMEFHVENASYIYLPKAKTFLTTNEDIDIKKIIFKKEKEFF